MAAWWIDTTYMGNMIGTAQRDAITGSSSTVFEQLENAATATVMSTLLAVGYPAIGTTLTAGTPTTAFLQTLAAGMWLRNALASRKGVQLPQAALDAVDLMNAMLKDARTGSRLAPPVPGLDRDTLAGIGGAEFPPNAPTSTGDTARPMRFDRTSLRSY